MPNLVMQAAFYKRREVPGLERVTVRQKFSNHSLTFLDYKFTDKRQYLLPPENTPVKVQWGEGPTGVRTFYGYVNHYETVPDQTTSATTRMVLMGTSKVMRAANPTSWMGQTRSSIVRDIATRYRLRSVIYAHPYPQASWASGVRSDWECLKALADEAGYRLWVDGSTVWFLDPLRLLRTASTMTTPIVKTGQISGLSVMGGSSIPGGMNSSTRRLHFGLDYRTNEFFEATSGDPAFPTEVVSASAVTYSDAQETADAANRLQQDYYELKASIQGDARHQPGALTRFESGTVNTDQAGLWLVNEAQHEVMRSEFTSRIVATRNADQQPMSRTVDTVRGMAGVTAAVVRDGLTWEAALQEQVHA